MFVCINGIKRVPQASFQQLSSILLSIGFSYCQVDPYIFVSKKDSMIFDLLVYLDDIILTWNDVSINHTFIVQVNKEFLIIDIGKLIYFLGLEVSYHDTVIFLSQSTYAHDILARAVRLMLNRSQCLSPPLLISQVKVLFSLILHGINLVKELFNISPSPIQICHMMLIKLASFCMLQWKIALRLSNVFFVMSKVLFLMVFHFLMLLYQLFLAFQM